MKRLYLLRHAKSSWDDPTLSDSDRPLNKRGRKAAPRIGKLLRQRGWLPELVLCSSAARAKETWELAAAELKPPPTEKRLKNLYLATPSQLLRALQRSPAACGSVLLIGHNPGLATLATQLAGPGSDRKALARLREKYPTAGLAIFDVEGEDWTGASPGRCALSHFVVPSDLD